MLRIDELASAEPALELPARLPPGGLVTLDPTLAKAFDELARIATSDVPVLVGGPTGSGKERVAQTISQLVGITSGAITGFVVALSIGDWSRGLHIGWSAFLGYAGILGAGAVIGFMVKPLMKASPTTR